MNRVLKGAPGPSPWYLSIDPPTIRGFRWEPDPTGKFTLLIGQNGPVAAFGMYNYTMALGETTLLVWNQRPDSDRDFLGGPVSLSIVEPHELRPLGSDFAAPDDEGRSYRNGFILGGGPSAEVALQTMNAADEMMAKFPVQLHTLDEILILCHSSGIPKPPGCLDVALMVAQPRLSKYRLYPQDWFNAGNFDYGYQWITRMARDPQTGFVHGEGFRIAPFILDDSLRNLRDPSRR